MSTYTAFDNNPVLDDPSELIHLSNWDRGHHEQYDDDGKFINDNANYEDALAWAESQNNVENDEPNPIQRGHAKSTDGGPKLVSAGGGLIKVVEVEVTTSTTATATAFEVKVV